MKIKLVFPPPSNPTYIPLGIASLVSYLDGLAAGAEVVPLDSNLAAWRFLTRNSPGGPAFWDFMGGKSENFYDRAAYARHQGEWEKVRGKLDSLHRDVRVYLDTGLCDRATLDFLDSLAGEILAGEPSAVGFSVLFPDQLAFAAALAKHIRGPREKRRSESSRAKPSIFFGGALMSAINVEELLTACHFIDAVAVGEGEVPISCLARGLSYENIPNVYFGGNGNVRKPCEGIPVLLDRLPAPDFGGFPLDRYANPLPVFPLTLSRNCKWGKCRFCAHNFSFSLYREKSVAMFVNDMERLIERFDVRHFYFADQYVSAATLNALSDEILARNLRIHFHAMGRPTANYSAELLFKASAAGCRWISWGVETGSQRLLNLMRKGTHANTIRKVLENSSRAGISNLAMMIFGLPTSGEEDLRETFDLIEDVYPYASAFTASSFALFENTWFARNAEKCGLTVVKREELFRSGEVSVHSGRLQYMRISSGKEPAPPLGPIEIARWTQRRQWLGEVPFEENLCCEHFLLHAASKAAPPLFNPVRPATGKAA